MAEYMSKEVFLSSMGLTGDETKYGNRDAEHQHRSYSTYMSYEVMDSVDDSIVEEELAPVRHGRWLEWFPGDCAMIMTGEEMLYRCSLCDAKYSDVEGYKYCPNCGARMNDA